jgi:hypothetical protein
MSDIPGCVGHLPPACGGCPNREHFLAELAGITGLELEEHREHHEFVRELVEEMRARKRLRQKLIEQVGGWAVITVLGAVGTFVWHAVQNWLKTNGGTP